MLTRGLGNMGDMDGDVAARGNFAPAQSPEPIGIGTMRELAAATGGKAFVNTNDLTGAIREAIEGSAANYTLGFYVDPSSLDGKFHELKLRVKRSGVSVHCPTGYFALEERNPSETQHRDRLMAAAQSPLESSAIVVQAKLARVNEPAPNSFKILSSIDIHNLQLVQEGTLHKGAIAIYLIEQDQTGKTIRESNQALNRKLNEKEYADYLRTGILFNKYVRPEPGVTTLRLLVQDRSSAAIGSLIIPLAQIK